MSEKVDGDVEKSPPEHTEQPEQKPEVTDFVPPTPKEEAAVIRKLDFRLIPLVFLLYMLSVLDRSNLGNARLAGLEVSISSSSMYPTVASTNTTVGRYRPQRKQVFLARHHLLHLLHRLAMAAHGLETLQAAHLVRRRRHVLGLRRLHPGCYD